MVRRIVLESGAYLRSIYHVWEPTEPLAYHTPKALNIVAQGK